MIMKQGCSRKISLLSATLLSSVLLSGAGHAGNIKVEPSSIAMVDPYDSPDIKKTKDGYRVNSEFNYDNKEMNADIIIDDDMDQSIILFNDTRKDFELYKVVVDHQKDGSYDFYGYEGITGTIVLENGFYQFDMKDKSPLTSFNIRNID